MRINEGVISMIKTGIYYWFGYQIESKERFRLITEAGFDNVLLWWGDEFIGFDGNTNHLPEIARTIGLEIENVHAPFDKTNRIWTESVDAEDIVKRYAQCILDCSHHNIPTVVIHLTNGDTPPPPTQLGLDRIKYLVELAEQKGVSIALENLRKPEYLQFVFSNIQSSKLGFCYDSGHENCYSKGTDLLSAYVDKLMALHLHDNDGTDDQHRIPGEGTINWDNIVRKIKSTRYYGAISLEVTNEFSKQYSGISAQEFLVIANKEITNLFT
jgi:sugar phosphate isomerase/epimerase